MFNSYVATLAAWLYMHGTVSGVQFKYEDAAHRVCLLNKEDDTRAKCVSLLGEVG